MSMILKARNGNEFELALVHDSLSDKHDAVGDANWATVHFRAASATNAWEETAPCLNLYEFATLAEWLEAVGSPDDARGDVSEVELLQPELRFTLVHEAAQAVTIRIWFHLADRPEEFNVDDPTDEADFLDLYIERDNVLTAAAVLHEMVSGLTDTNLKDDLTGDAQHGVMGEPDNELNLIDRVTPTPPGVAMDEDEGYLEDQPSR